MEKLIEEIQEIQKFLHSGYKNEGTTNLDWLNVSMKILFNYLRCIV